MESKKRSTTPNWTLITNHATVLVYIAAYRRITAAEMASKLDLTERQVRRIISDLLAAGYIEKTRVRKVNQYSVNFTKTLRRPESKSIKVGELLDLFLKRGTWGRPLEP